MARAAQDIGGLSGKHRRLCNHVFTTESSNEFEFLFFAPTEGDRRSLLTGRAKPEDSWELRVLECFQTAIVCCAFRRGLNKGEAHKPKIRWSVACSSSSFDINYLVMTRFTSNELATHSTLQWCLGRDHDFAACLDFQASITEIAVTPDSCVRSGVSRATDHL